MLEKPTPDELATENLKRICAKLGASYSPDHRSWSPMNDLLYPGPWVRIAIDGATYYISVGYIYKEYCGYCLGTCFWVVEDAARAAQLPYAELVASALLLLKNDPCLFVEWLKHDGPHA